MWGENGAVNGNGQQMALADTYLNHDGMTWATPKIWSVTSEITHHFSPEFCGSLEGSYGQVLWHGTNDTSMVSNSYTWLAAPSLTGIRSRTSISSSSCCISMPIPISLSDSSKINPGNPSETASRPASKSPAAGNRPVRSKIEEPPERKLRGFFSSARTAAPIPSPARHGGARMALLFPRRSPGAAGFVAAYPCPTPHGRPARPNNSRNSVKKCLKTRLTAF